MFFSFLAGFPLPESYQNDPKFHFNTLLRSDTQKSSKNVENTTVFWSRCETAFGVWSRCETVFGPPPAKADIATAILTNVIEHLVLLLPPNKHAFTAKAVRADLCLIFTILFQQGRLGKLPFFRLIRYGKTKDTIEPFWDESAERLERWWLQLGQKINGISQWKSAWW